MKNAILGDVLKIGLAAAVIVVAIPDPALAQTLGESVNEVKTGMQFMPIVLSGLAYLGGGATMMHGAGLLKKHADSPAQTPLAQGLMRMAVGAMVAALPMLMGWVVDSLSTRGNDLGFVALQPITG